MGIIDWIKSHPLYDVLIAVGLFLLIVLLRSSGGSSAVAVPVSTGPSDAVQEANIAASAQQAQTTAAANVQSQQTQAQYDLGIASLQVQAGQNTLAEQLGLAQVNSQTAQANIAAGLGVAQAQAQVAIAQSANDAEVTAAGITANENTSINEQNQRTQQAQISAQSAAYAAQLAAAEQENESNNATQLGLATSAAGVLTTQSNNQTAAAEYLAMQQAGVQNNQTAAALAAAGLQAGVENNQINTEGNLGIASINSQTQLGLAGINAQQSIIENGQNLQVAGENNLLNFISTTKPSTTAIQSLAGAFAFGGNTANSSVSAPNTSSAVGAGTQAAQIIGSLGKITLGLFGT